MAKQRGGRMPPEGINPAELPPAMALAWHWFLELNSRRSVTVTMAGAQQNPISFTEMRAYFELMGEWPDPLEVELLTRLDRLALAMQGDEPDEPEQPTEPPDH